MKPLEALLDSVTICAVEPAVRSALVASTTAEPEATIITAWASALATLAAMGAKSGVARSNFSDTTAVRLAAAKPFCAPWLPSAPKLSSAYTSATRLMPMEARWVIAFSASRW